MREVSQPFRLNMQLHFKLNPRSRMISDKWKMVFLCFQLLPAACRLPLPPAAAACRCRLAPAACPCPLPLPPAPAPAACPCRLARAACPCRLLLPPAPASCRSLVGTEALAALPGLVFRVLVRRRSLVAAFALVFPG